MMWATVRFTADTEILMNSVERIQHFTELPNEPKGGQKNNSILFTFDRSCKENIYFKECFFYKMFGATLR